MRYLTRSVPAKYVAVVLIAATLGFAIRAREVLASMNDAEAQLMLERAHHAYAAGEYEDAMNYAHDAAVIAPDTPEVLVSASDYAFVLGMSRFQPAGTAHIGDFNTGLDYATRAHKIAPDDTFVHREYAESLLLAYLYDVPVSRAQLQKSWRTLPVETGSESAYRNTALRIANRSKH